MIVIGADPDVISEAKKSGFDVKGVVDNDMEGEFDGVPVLGGDKQILSNPDKYYDQKIVMGMDDCNTRSKLYKKYEHAGFKFATINNSQKCDCDQIGEGTIIMEGAILSGNSKIGKNCKIGYNSIVGHDTDIGDFSILAPGASLLGYSSIGKRCFMGASSNVCPRISVNEGVKLTVGSTLAEDINRKCIIFGYYPVPGMFKIVPKI